MRKKSYWQRWTWYALNRDLKSVKNAAFRNFKLLISYYMGKYLEFRGEFIGRKKNEIIMPAKDSERT